MELIFEFECYHKQLYVIELNSAQIGLIGEINLINIGLFIFLFLIDVFLFLFYLNYIATKALLLFIEIQKMLLLFYCDHYLCYYVNTKIIIFNQNL